MAPQRLSRPCRLVQLDGEPALQVDSGCGSCTAGCGPASGPRHVPLRWLGVDPGDLTADAMALSVRAAGLTRAAVLCFGLPVLALLAGGAVGSTLAAGTALDRELAAALGGLGSAWAALVWATSRAARRLADLDPLLLRSGSLR